MHIRTVETESGPLAVAYLLVPPLPAPRVIKHFHILPGLRIHKPLARDLPVALGRGVLIVIPPTLKQSADDKNGAPHQDLDPTMGNPQSAQVGTQCQGPESK